MLPLSSPTKLGRYEIVDEIGKGAMGVVYLARDPLIGRLVALKTFRIGYSVRDAELEQFRARFIREAQSAGILSHPNIVTIHDVVERGDEGLAFIAMEYVRGTNLKSVLQEPQRPTFPYVVEILSQIADGLDYAHSCKVIHRDIKPANILITTDNRAKITDFGIARLDTSNLTQEGQLLGTPNYMSPEQILGRDVDSRADISSLGVVLYELITRHKPFQGENLTMVSHRIVYDQFTPPRDYVSDLPPGCEQILAKALEKDPARRYQRARDLADDLRKVLGSVGTRDVLNETQSLSSTAMLPPERVPAGVRALTTLPPVAGAPPPAGAVGAGPAAGAAPMAPGAAAPDAAPPAGPIAVAEPAAEAGGKRSFWRRRPRGESAAGAAGAPAAAAAAPAAAPGLPATPQAMSGPALAASPLPPGDAGPAAAPDASAAAPAYPHGTRPIPRPELALAVSAAAAAGAAAAATAGAAAPAAAVPSPRPPGSPVPQGPAVAGGQAPAGSGFPSAPAAPGLAGPAPAASGLSGPAAAPPGLGGPADAPQGSGGPSPVAPSPAAPGSAAAFQGAVQPAALPAAPGTAGGAAAHLAPGAVPVPAGPPVPGAGQASGPGSAAPAAVPAPAAATPPVRRRGFFGRPSAAGVVVAILAGLVLGGGVAAAALWAARPPREPAAVGARWASEQEQRLRLASLVRDGRARLDSGDAAGAAASFRAAEQLAPGSRALRARLAEAEGQESAQRQRIGQERQIETKLDEGRQALKDRRYDEAEAAAQAVLAVSPGNTVAGAILDEARTGRARRRDQQLPVPVRPAATAAPVVAPPLVRPDTRAQPAAPAPAPEAKDVAIDLNFDSQMPRGSLIIYANGRPVWREQFRFYEKESFFRSRPTPGTLHHDLHLAPGPVEIRVYVTPEGSAAVVKNLPPVTLAGGATRRLDVRLSADGQVTAQLN
jgi:tRNA A-37 threonylcarbamoyl transferase component Bud32